MYSAGVRATHDDAFFPFSLEEVLRERHNDRWFNMDLGPRKASGMRPPYLVRRPITLHRYKNDAAYAALHWAALLGRCASCAPERGREAFA